MHDEDKRVFIETLAEENENFYGTPDGYGALQAFELIFEHRWIYIFELIQNALDANAKSISLRLSRDGDILTFQHDGDSPLEKKDVKSLSKIFKSTKGASAVGFMGVGFKSVFGRFLEAHVSGWGWKFRYEVQDFVGKKFGDRQPDLIGAVTPIWDPDILPPEHGFTTRFELRRRIDPNKDLCEDLASFLSEKDRTPLAILAESGLKSLELDKQLWELDTRQEEDGSIEATALSKNESLYWQLFPVFFEPSNNAIASFLEHRRIRPSEENSERVYSEAAQRRRVLGVLPLDNSGVPVPPKRGRVYATLPTEMTLPYGIHINADWLLNISRTGLQNIDDNPWQRDIVVHIADVLGLFFKWVSRIFFSPEIVKEAFSVLVLPSHEHGNRLESLLLEESWLNRLYEQLIDEPVLPVWHETSDKLSYAKSKDIINPPFELSIAFAEEPEIQPATLMKDPVLARDIITLEAYILLKEAGLVCEISPKELEYIWKDGLENWWIYISNDETHKRNLLFCIWGAVAELMSNSYWQEAYLPCIRTAGGEWLSANEVVYFNEQLPSVREPGGARTRELMESYIPDASSHIPDTWIGELRRMAGNEKRKGPLSKVRDWIEKSGRSIDFSEAIQLGVDALKASPDPDWSVLISLGHWVMHRQTRPQLLTHVLIEKGGSRFGILTPESLVADPYVERGRSRERLFPGFPPISSAYLEEDPKGVDAQKWRELFEKAGAQGKLKVKSIEIEKERSERKDVADFLGVDLDKVEESNNQGYLLLDFEINPRLPDKDASQNLLAALAPWLEDGFSALQGRGYRQVSYHKYSQKKIKGSRLSSWAEKLNTLAWVPCKDECLRPPKYVLSNVDPAREEAPVALLSSELVSVLKQEGIEFGAEIPEAPALRRLVARGEQLGAVELANLLREIKEQIETKEDARRFKEAIHHIFVPSSDGRRFPLNRIVKRTGAGGFRSSLGGWILSLADVDDSLRTELEHQDFPYEFPGTTTGAQALDYIQGVWSQARSAPEGLAMKVRDVLPDAYVYCLEDKEKDDKLAECWAEAVSECAVFAEREWIILSKSNQPVCFDDLEDRRFVPRKFQRRTATSGHLGNTREQQRRTAKEIGLPLLSSLLEIEWYESQRQPVPEWQPRIDHVCNLLSKLQGSVRHEKIEKNVDNQKVEELRYVDKLSVNIGVEDSAPEHISMHARLQEKTLILSGFPPVFASDAAKELLRWFGLRHQEGIAEDLTGLIATIDNFETFKKAINRFIRLYVPEYVLPFDLQITQENSEKSERSKESVDTIEDEKKTKNENLKDKKTNLASGSFGQEDALKKQQYYYTKYKKSLIGEIEPDNGTDQSNDTAEKSNISINSHSDEIYRKIAEKYESLHGRKPYLGDPLQEGWDLKSIDSETGTERLIEVKGKSSPWEEDEIIELRRAQVKKAFEIASNTINYDWYLYVVEWKGGKSFDVVPIANPALEAEKWMLRGEAWRGLAEAPLQVDLISENTITGED